MSAFGDRADIRPGGGSEKFFKEESTAADLSASILSRPAQKPPSPTPNRPATWRDLPWVAAGSPEEAVSLVLNVIPEGWTASLSQEQLTPDEVTVLNLKPGDVHEITRTIRTN
jgi:hypothetical protein